MTVTTRVDYAPGFSPLNLPAAGDWQVLSTAVLSYSDSRGRQDATADMDPGSATFVLDASAGDLDPLVSGSKLYGADGVPGTPIRLVLVEDGTTDHVWFTGFMWDEGPSPTSDRKSLAMEVTIRAQDLIGWGSSHPMPDCVWSTFATYSIPEIWIRGVSNFDSSANPALSGTFKAYNFGWGTQYANASGAANVSQFDSIIDGTTDPALGVSSASSLPMSAAVTASTSTNWVVAFGFQRVGTSGLGRNLAQCVSGGNLQWRISMDSGGLIHANAYNSSGTFLNGAVTVNGNGDDGNPHWVIATFDKTGHTITLYTDLDPTARTATTGLSTMVSSSGTITLMPTNVGSTPACLIQGFVYSPEFLDVNSNTLGGTSWFDGTITYDGTLAPTYVNTRLAGGTTAAVRVAYSYSVAASVVPVLTNSPDLAVDAVIGAVDASWLFSGWRSPPNFGDALTRIGTSMGGATYIERDGKILVRDLQALTSATPALVARFQTELANLTDEDSPAGSPTPVRYTSPTRTGARTDRIINTVTATAYVATYSNSAKFATVTALDTTSYATNGACPKTIDSDCYQMDLLQTVVDDLVATYADPVTELGALTVDCLVDSNARDWVLNDLELETAFHYHETTSDGAAVPLNGTYRVQHIETNIDRDTWTVAVVGSPI